MNYTLFHYVHCPFCVRVRMTLGLLEIPYESVVLPYDDEKTPVQLTGKKMLPALRHDGGVLNESLDIMALVDKKNVLKVKETPLEEFELLLNRLGSSVHSLAMPYWIWTPEFNDQSRTYFQKKKEEKRGPFKDLVKNQHTFIAKLEAEWPALEKDLKPFYKSDFLTVKDILLAAHLWGLYVVPEFQFPPNIHAYLQAVKKKCRFNYHEDFWR